MTLPILPVHSAHWYEVGAVAIALEVSAKVCAEDVVQVGGGLVSTPVIADAVGKVVENPKVGGRCFSGLAAIALATAGARGGDRLLVSSILEANFDALNDLANTTGGHVVEKFGSFVADDFVSFGVGFVYGWEVGSFFSLECVEAFDVTVVFSLGLFSFCVVGLLQLGCFVGGGLVLFWLFDSLEKKLQHW